MMVLSLIVVGQQETPAASQEDESAKQEHSPQPILSKDAPSAEQIAVYRAVLADYLNGSDGALNVANLTEPLDRSDRACFKCVKSGDATLPTPVIHRLEPSILVNTQIRLVNAGRQRETVRDNDPQNLLKRAIDGHEKVTNEQLDHSVERALPAARRDCASSPCDGALAQVGTQIPRSHTSLDYQFCSSGADSPLTPALQRLHRAVQKVRRRALVDQLVRRYGGRSQLSPPLHIGYSQSSSCYLFERMI